jgi:DNA-binding transcriptional regulator GbsR (MarR family)
MEVKTRDLRIKEKYQIDDEYLNVYARLCGWKATIVYNSLCRHASADQYSFPSIKLMSEQHGVSRDTIIKGIKTLEEWNIIVTQKHKRSKQGTWRCNGYVLLDKSEWKRAPSRPQRPGTESTTATSPSRPQRLDRVDHSDTKDTHKKDTHIKVKKVKNVKNVKKEENLNKQIQEVITMFEVVNPSYHLLFERPPQRKAAEELLKKWTVSQIRAVVNILPQLNADRYAKGKSITPYELLNNLGHVKAYIDQKNNENNYITFIS